MATGSLSSDALLERVAALERNLGGGALATPVRGHEVPSSSSYGELWPPPAVVKKEQKQKQAESAPEDLANVESMLREVTAMRNSLAAKHRKLLQRMDPSPAKRRPPAKKKRPSLKSRPPFHVPTPGEAKRKPRARKLAPVKTAAEWKGKISKRKFPPAAATSSSSRASSSRPEPVKKQEMPADELRVLRELIDQQRAQMRTTRLELGGLKRELAKVRDAPKEDDDKNEAATKREAALRKKCDASLAEARKARDFAEKAVKGHTDLDARVVGMDEAVMEAGRAVAELRTETEKKAAAFRTEFSKLGDRVRADGLSTLKRLETAEAAVKHAEASATQAKAAVAASVAMAAERSAETRRESAAHLLAERAAREALAQSLRTEYRSLISEKLSEIIPENSSPVAAVNDAAAAAAAARTRPTAVLPESEKSPDEFARAQSVFTTQAPTVASKPFELPPPIQQPPSGEETTKTEQQQRPAGEEAKTPEEQPSKHSSYELLWDDEPANEPARSPSKDGEESIAPLSPGRDMDDPYWVADDDASAAPAPAPETAIRIVRGVVRPGSSSCMRVPDAPDHHLVPIDNDPSPSVP